MSRSSEPAITRKWARLPTWLYVFHLVIFFWLGACVGFAVGSR